jgi:hypothetical protein
MITKRDLIVGLTVLCIAALLFSAIPVIGQTRVYDPWLDVNDDGYIDIEDIYTVAIHYGAEAGPGDINKTAMLLDLQSRVSALEERSPAKGYISLGGSAFSPEEKGQTYTQTYYKYYSYLRGLGWFDADLQLPDGAVLTNISVSLHDSVSDGECYVFLRGRNITQDRVLGQSGQPWMAAFTTGITQTPGDVVLYQTAIANATVDNKNCVYALSIVFTYDSIFLHMDRALIEYTYAG